MSDSQRVEGEGSQQMTADFFIPGGPALFFAFSALQVGRTLLASVVALTLPRASLCFGCTLPGKNHKKIMRARMTLVYRVAILLFLPNSQAIETDNFRLSPSYN
jgi:hypothetical protein